MLVEKYIMEKMFPDKREGFQDIKPNLFKTIILLMFQIFIIVVAGYLAWDCNKNQPPALRFLITTIAIIFSGVYILFYVIYRNILNVECK